MFCRGLLVVFFVIIHRPVIATDYKYPKIEYKILLIGDSHVNGIGARLKSSLPKEVQFKYKGINGTSIRNWVHAAKDMTKPEAPDVVLISLGTNDAVLDDPNAEVKDLHKMIDNIQSQGVLVVWITPPDLSRKLSRLGLVRMMISDSGVMIMDFRNLLIPLCDDLVHPTPKGYDIWSDHIHRMLMSLLKVKT